MALTLSNFRQGVEDRRRFVEADVQFPNPYTVGGEAVSLAALGLERVTRIQVVFNVYPDGGASSFANHGRQVVPDLTNVQAPKLKLNVSNATESGAVDQTQVISRIRFIGN